MKHLPEILSKLGKGSLIVLDRGFSNFPAFALCRENGVHALVRGRDDQMKNLCSGRLRKGETIIVFQPGQPSRVVPIEQWNKINHMIVLRRIITTATYPDGSKKKTILLTTLLDPDLYPADELVALYLRRWEIETGFRNLKKTLKLDVLKGQSLDVVMKEIIVHAIAYNMVRLVMLASAERRKVTPERISFIDALRWLRWDRKAESLALLIVNEKRNRCNIRMVRRRRNSFSYMTQERSAYPPSNPPVSQQIGA